MSVCKDKNHFYNSIRGIDNFYTIWDETINKMVYCNNRQFEKKELEDLTVLSVDLETIGLLYMLDKQILLIPVAYQVNNKVTTKLFSIDEYDSERDMLVDFLAFLKELNPQVMVGHNLFGFDLPYFKERFESLLIDHDWQFDNERRRDRRFRVDGGLATEYRGVNIPGVEIVDTLFLTKKADFNKQFKTYKLKSICKDLDINQGRQNYDASKIGQNWHIPEEREKIKAYAQDDALDALALYNMFIPPFFDLVKIIPINLQEIINRASGMQLNTMMVCQYLMRGHSIPKPDEIESFAGGISRGKSGIYRNCFQLDYSQFYPSIIMSYNLYDNKKDELQLLPQLCKQVADQRIVYKTKFKETGEKKYDNRQQALKIISNSWFGMTGTNGLNFNSNYVCAEITSKGRDLLRDLIQFMVGDNYEQTEEEFELKEG
jgi:DNA polymerase elongation subunit (family B)